MTLSSCHGLAMYSCIIKLSTILVFSAFPPPEKLYTSAIDIGSRKLSFTWSPVAPDCPAIHYNILASNCGSCPAITKPHTTVTCMDVPVNNDLCTFAAQTVTCENLTGNASQLLTINVTETEMKGTPMPLYGAIEGQQLL